MRTGPRGREDWSDHPALTYSRQRGREGFTSASGHPPYDYPIGCRDSLAAQHAARGMPSGALTSTTRAGFLRPSPSTCPA